jgi:hypothetical protein
MKAVLALIIIYVGTFFVAIQGASQTSVEASEVGGAGQIASSQRTAADPVKDADVRSLTELIGVKEQVQDSVKNSAEQTRDKLLATVTNDNKGRAFVNAFSRDYENKFDVNQVTEQIVGIYDQHFTDDEIKGLLQFYGSPLGQKYASEMPKIAREIQIANREAGSKAARESLQNVKNQYPEVGENAKLGTGERAGQLRGQFQPMARQAQR